MGVIFIASLVFALFIYLIMHKRVAIRVWFGLQLRKIKKTWLIQTCFTDVCNIYGDDAIGFHTKYQIVKEVDAGKKWGMSTFVGTPRRRESMSRKNSPATLVL